MEKNAKRTVIDAGISDMVELILSDGLKNVPENSCDDIVLAGMGGNLIADILSDCPWIYNENLHIIAQPMSHGEVLREFYINNGFEILKEKTVADGKRLYCVISAVFTGAVTAKDKSYIYLGKLTENRDETTKKYIDKILSALEKKHSSLVNAGKDDMSNLGEIIFCIKNKISEVYNGNG